MYLPGPGRPRFWKAVVATALFVVPLSLLTRLAFKVNDLTWIATAVGATFVIAALIQLRLKPNWMDLDSRRMAQLIEVARISPDLSKDDAGVNGNRL